MHQISTNNELILNPYTLSLKENSVMRTHWNPKKKCLFAFLPALIVGGVASTVFAHDDDIRKLLDRQPAIHGPIWTQSMQSRGGEQYASMNVTLLSHIPLNNFTGLDNSGGNDCWGYVSPAGKEYAIMCLEGGYGFVDITDPVNPVIIETIAGPIGMWHDVKVLGEYAYGVSESGSGIQIIDLSMIDQGEVSLVRNWTSGGYSTTHNIVSNEESGTLWLAGSNIGNGGLINIDLSSPELPALNGGWTEMYVHDAQVVSWKTGELAGKELAFIAGGFSTGYSVTGLRIVDVTDPENTETLSTLFYPDAGYAHQLWLSTDRKFLYLNDELDEGFFVPVTTTRIINIEDPSNPILVGIFSTGSPAADHNLYTRDHYIYQANYRSGLRVFDALDPSNPIEVAYFDTYPDSDAPRFNGAWSNYPYFPSGNTIISDTVRGLFVVRVEPEERPMALAAAGRYPAAFHPAGGATLSVRPILRSGAQVQSVSLLLDTGSGYFPLRMIQDGQGVYSVDLPSLSCGVNIQYYFEAESNGGFSTNYPTQGKLAPLTARVTSSENNLFGDDFETDLGWTLSGSADYGAWERGVPTSTGGQGDFVSDSDGSGQCYVTGILDQEDVDGGTTVLTSPAMDGSSGSTTLSYDLWYVNAVGVLSGPADDRMQVQLSNNDGDDWETINTLGPEAEGGGWTQYDHQIDDIFSSPTEQLRVRFVVSDLGQDSIVEAGVDDVRLVQRVCVDMDLSCNAADLAGPLGELDFFDVSAFLDAFGAQKSSADLTNDGEFDFFDVSAFLDAFGQGCP